MLANSGEWETSLHSSKVSSENMLNYMSSEGLRLIGTGTKVLHN